MAQTENAVAYLQLTAKEQPEFMLMALSKVLEARPDLAAVFIPTYAHLLKSEGLKQLEANFPAARTYISEHLEALSLMAIA